MGAAAVEDAADFTQASLYSSYILYHIKGKNKKQANLSLFPLGVD